MVSSIPQREVNGALQAVPTSLTPITSHNAVILELSVFNPSSGTLNFTLTDKTGTPIKAFDATPILTKQYLTLTSTEGMIMSLGVQWQASGSGLTGAYRIRAEGITE